MNTRPARFAEMLIKEGMARPLGAKWETWRYRLPDEITGVAQAIKRLLR
jgi:hypothetical protein